MIGDLLVGGIISLIPDEIWKIVGIILIGIGILLSLIAIPLWLMDHLLGYIDLGIMSTILAIPIVLSFLFGFLFILIGSERGSRNVSLLD